MAGPDSNGIATSRIADELRAHQIDVLRVDAGLRNRILEILQDVEDELVAAIVAVDPTEPKRLSFKIKRKEKLLAEVRGKILSIYRLARDTELRASRQLAGIETTFANVTMREGLALIDVNYSAVSFSDEFLDAVAANATIDGIPSSRWWAKQAGDTLFRFDQEISRGIIAGDTVPELVTRIVGGTRDGVEVKGVMDTSRRNAEALVRTKVSAVANDAHLAVYRRNADIVDSLEHFSTLDNKTTQQCIVRDGLRWTLDGEPIGHDVPFDPPPVHWNCRSVMGPVIKGAEDLEGDRASETGPVPATETFEQYMTRRGTKFQNEVLGPTRAQLWRDGEIEIKDLLDFKGDPLTLDQLAERVGGS